MAHQFQRTQDPIHHLCHIGFLIGPDFIQDLFADHLITDFSVQIIKFAVDTFPFFLPQQVLTEVDLINLLPVKPVRNIRRLYIICLAQQLFQSFQLFRFQALEVFLHTKGSPFRRTAEVPPVLPEERTTEYPSDTPLWESDPALHKT